MIIEKKIVAILCIICVLKNQAFGQYLSDYDPAYKQIEEIQKHNDDSSKNLLLILNEKYFTKRNAYNLLKSLYKKEKNRGNRYSKKEADSIIDEQFKYFFPSLYPTRFQDPAQYMVIANTFENVELAAKEICPKLYQPPKFGTFYSNAITAEAKAINGDYLILIHSKLLGFINQIGKMSAQLFKDRDIKRLFENDWDTSYYNMIIDSSVEYRKNFILTFLQFKYKNFRGADSLNSRSDKWTSSIIVEKLWDYWSGGCETFLIGHEYAHALLKHIRKDGGEFITDTAILTSWFNEIEADSLSQELLNKVVKTIFSDDETNAMWRNYNLFGGIFLLKALDIFENCVSILETDTKAIDINSRDSAILMEIFGNRASMNENIKKFKTINPQLRKLDHPPNKIRIALLENKLSKQWEGSLDPSNDELKNFAYLVGVQCANLMLYSLNRLYQSIENSLHIAHKGKDELKKFYKE